MWRPHGHVLIKETDLTLLGQQLSADHVEYGRFAGPIGPKQYAALTRKNVDGEVADGLYAAKTNRDVLQRYRCHDGPSRGLGRIAFRSSPTMPAGATITENTSSPPKTNVQWAV